MTKTLTTLACLAALTCTAGAAHAEGARPASATLAVAPARTEKMVLQDYRWVCEGAACTGAVGGGKVDVVRTCRELSRKLGAVTDFTVAGAATDAETLTACNADAKKVAKAN